jgi:hypothetical protein
VVLGNSGAWAGFYSTNVSADLHIDPQKNPKFLMVTGVVSMRRAGGTRTQPANSACYVAEITSGQVAAYTIQWSPSLYKSNRPQNGQISLINKSFFRQGMGPGPGGSGAVPAN